MKWKRPFQRTRTRTRTRRRSNHNPPVRRDEKFQLFRSNIIYLFVFLSFTSLILRLGYVQIVRGAWFRTQSTQTSLYKVPVLPARGWIYDANGNLLAYDKPSYSLFLTQLPHVNQSFSDIATRLAPQFQTSAASIEALIAANQSYATMRLFKDLTAKQLAFVEENKNVLPGVNVVMDSQRVYPDGTLAGKVLGYVGKITPETKDAYHKLGYLATQSVGVTGLELQYESLLKGKVGYQVAEVTSQGTPLKQFGFDPPETSGYNLQLTLDGHLQALAQQAVMDTVQKSPLRSNIRNAEIVVLDVKTGGVLAMVSYPNYDPNWFTVGPYSPHVHYLQTSDAQLNNAIQSARYPGSTVKPANIYTGLTKGAITPSTIINDWSPTYVGTAALKDDGYHAQVDPMKAIVVSCDTYLYQVGLRLGHWFGSTSSSGGHWPSGMSLSQWLNTDYVKGIDDLFLGEWQFGLGQLTGIDLPGENPGHFYIEDSQNQYYQTPYDPVAAQKSLQKTGSFVTHGSPVDLAFGAIGQSQQFTPIELAQYVATIADGGIRIQPHLLEKVFAPSLKRFSLKNATPVRVVSPHVQANLHLNAAALQLVQQGMYGVANSPDGTAAGTFMNAPYKAAGKTGTAEIRQNGIKMLNSVFIGYAPFDAPQIAVAVMMPGAGYGADAAVPLARQVMDDYFKEHHEFFPSSQWEPLTVPANWTQMSAYTIPETSK